MKKQCDVKDKKLKRVLALSKKLKKRMTDVLPIGQLVKYIKDGGCHDKGIVGVVVSMDDDSQEYVLDFGYGEEAWYSRSDIEAIEGIEDDSTEEQKSQEVAGKIWRRLYKNEKKLEKVLRKRTENLNRLESLNATFKVAGCDDMCRIIQVCGANMKQDIRIRPVAGVGVNDAWMSRRCCTIYDHRACLRTKWKTDKKTWR